MTEHEFERRHLLNRDDPGAPPGYLLDPDDQRTHRPIAPAPRTGKPDEDED